MSNEPTTAERLEEAHKLVRDIKRAPFPEISVAKIKIAHKALYSLNDQIDYKELLCKYIDFVKECYMVDDSFLRVNRYGLTQEEISELKKLAE